MEAIKFDAPLIEAHGVTKRYNGFTLNSVDLTVEAGRVVGFIGQNGAGKSTTIKALLGLISIDGGEARVLGVPAHELEQSSSQVKEDIGVVFDTVSVPGHLKVAEVGQLMASAYASWDAPLFDRLLAQFKLERTKAVKDLSRGMGMKLSLACALAHDPRLLILDEATAGLDPMARDEVLEILRAFVAMEDAQGRLRNAILMSSHITSDLEKMADEIVCIDEGRIVFTCAKDEICDFMGVARCRAAEVDEILASPLAPAGMRSMAHDYGVDVLVPDRFAFAKAFPQIPCDRVTIDDYMMLTLKGEVLAPRPEAPKGGER